MNTTPEIRPADFSTGGVVIRVEDLWKQYRLGTINHGTLVKDLQSWWARLRGREDPNLKIARHGVLPTNAEGALAPDDDQATDRFWALREVAFDVHQGDVVGIIGRNGAGKSTLLKVLSQVTTPTRGQIGLRGRVASLLEVGTGFHPELTGRENVFLNGAILGMSKSEIRSKLDEIIAFAEIEKFIDTPVKRYSSGMYVRLAFAVAAHLEPEILIVDEVLAVGDAQFQKKCLGKMEEVGNEGRTVLFVSHNMGAVAKLCRKGILLDSGAVECIGAVGDVVENYLRSFISIKSEYFRENDASQPISLVSARMLSKKGISVDAIPKGDDCIVSLEYIVNRRVDSAHIYANLFNDQDILVFGTGDADVAASRFSTRMPGNYKCSFRLPTEILNDGKYAISISIGVPYKEVYQNNKNILGFNIVNLSGNEYLHARRSGILLVDIPWIYYGKEPNL